jgi:hypothetical protein
LRHSRIPSNQHYKILPLVFIVHLFYNTSSYLFHPFFLGSSFHRPDKIKNMMHRSWIKLHIEILDDIKMQQLPNWCWRRAITLFLLAGENDMGGLLRPVPELAWRLRIDKSDLINSLRTLSEIGVVHETPQGWMVTHFQESQRAPTGAERVRDHRKRSI